MDLKFKNSLILFISTLLFATINSNAEATRYQLYGLANGSTYDLNDNGVVGGQSAGTAATWDINSIPVNGDFEPTLINDVPGTFPTSRVFSLNSNGEMAVSRYDSFFDMWESYHRDANGIYTKFDGVSGGIVIGWSINSDGVIGGFATPSGPSGFTVETPGVATLYNVYTRHLDDDERAFGQFIPPSTGDPRPAAYNDNGTTFVLESYSANTNGQVNGTSNDIAVGYAFDSISGQNQVALWDIPTSAIYPLQTVRNPHYPETSQANDVHKSLIVGFAGYTNREAILWDLDTGDLIVFNDLPENPAARNSIDRIACFNELSSANAVNSDGIIIGEGLDCDDNVKHFVLIPE